MDLRLLVVPYDSGIHGWRMGAGPDRLLAAGAADRLRAAGHQVEVERIELPGPSTPEIRAAFELAERLAERVAASRSAGALPVVLAGNCVSAVGTLAGLSAHDPAILWLDAHADLNTPETTRSGMLDGMALAIATGRCWHTLAADIPAFRPVPEALVCLVGARDVDGPEAKLLRASPATVLSPSALAGGMDAALRALRERTSTVYLHIDLDVLDPAEGTANDFSAPGGLPLGQVLGLIAEVRARFLLGAVALTAYDPAHDDGRVSAAALSILDEIARRA